MRSTSQQMFQEDDITRTFLHVVRLCWSLPGPPWPENCFPDFWCLCNVWMNINRHINRLISLGWQHGITLLCREREERAAGRTGCAPSTPHIAMLILSHQPVGGRQSSSYPEAPVKQVNLNPLDLPCTLFSVHYSCRLTAVNPIHDQRWSSDEKHIG